MGCEPLLEGCGVSCYWRGVVWAGLLLEGCGVGWAAIGGVWCEPLLE